VPVIGGTPPYIYQWTTDNNDTTTQIENLPRNVYTVFVKDSRYQNEAAHKRCTAAAHVSIKSPDGMNVDTLIVNPTCNGYTDGKIELNITGGTLPYRIRWADGETGTVKNNLGSGNYEITVTDNNDCFIIEEYTLTEPEPVIVDLGEDFTLCAGQELTVKDKNIHENVFYEWTGANGSVLSAEEELTVTSLIEISISD
jgi:hypothetical protein